MSSEVASYFARLRTHLGLGDGFESDLVRELSQHVEDRVEDLGRRGVSEDRARQIAIEGFGRPRTLAHLLRQAELVTPWSEAMIGASPFLLLALMIGARLWQQPVAALIAGVAVVAIAVYGLWLGRPAWFYPWAGVALTFPILVGYLAFELLQREAAADTMTPVGLAGVAGAALYFPIGLIVVAAAVLVAVRRDWLDASVLLSPLPCAFAWVIAVHRAGGLTSTSGDLAQTCLLIGAVYACSAVVAVMFLRAPSRSLRVATLVGSSLVLLGGSMLLLDGGSAVTTIATRSALLLAFLLSPALVARHA